MAANRNYTSQEGDTFKKIAQAIFGDEIVAKVLAQFNKMDEVDAITGGTPLKIPERVHVVKKTTNQNGVPTSHVDVLTPQDRLVTFDQLKTISGASDAIVNKYLDHLNTVMKKFDITTPLRKAHFLAQICHESGGLIYTEELADGSAYEPPSDSATNLGNTEKGDGPRFKGRGLIQITGRTNYSAFGDYISQELTSSDNWLKLKNDPYLACLSAAWFWSIHITQNLNLSADKDDFLYIVFRVNGGFNGIEDRLKRLKRCFEAFDLNPLKSHTDKYSSLIDTNISKIKGLFGIEKIITHTEEKTKSDNEKKTFRNKLHSLWKTEKKITNFERILFLQFREISDWNEIVAKI
jgi:predicted chitinase